MRSFLDSARRWKIALVAVAVACGLGAHALTPWFPPAAAEALLVAALLYVLLASRPGIAAARAMPPRQRLTVTALVAAILAGHFHSKAYNTFPFVDWDIYAHVLHGNPHYFEYQAARQDGTDERVIPGELFPALRKKLAVQLEQLADAIETTGDPRRRAELVRWYEGLLLALARAYDRQHADARLTAIRIEKCTITLERYSGGGSVACEPFKIWTWRDTRP